MDYLTLITQLAKITRSKTARNDLLIAYKWLKKENVSSLKKEQAEKHFVYCMRPYFIFDLYPTLYNEKRWTGLSFDDYMRGINQALEKGVIV